jgi:hypothetical protein
MYRLKTTEIKPTRESMLASQKGRCGICKLPCSASEAVLDHDHDTGLIRGVAHRGCNALEGKVVNAYRRYGVKNLAAFLHGLPAYYAQYEVDRTGLLHPTHKTDDEKRLLRNKRARVARTKTKGPQ